MSSARFIFTKFFSKNICSSPVISIQNRSLSITSIYRCAATEQPTAEAAPVAEERNLTEKEKSIDRTRIIPVETSINYLASDAYRQTYGDRPVWEQYRRNFKGGFAPRNTRQTCIRGGLISTGSPCPICRDEYLVLDYRNLDLLKQFISPHSGQVKID